MNKNTYELQIKVDWQKETFSEEGVISFTSKVKQTTNGMKYSHISIVKEDGSKYGYANVISIKVKYNEN